MKNKPKRVQADSEKQRARTRLNKIRRMEKELQRNPNKWMENLVSNGKIGGVMLVFIEGFSEVEIKNKVKAITEFCKTIKDIPEWQLATKLGGKHTQEQKDKISQSIKEHWEKRNHTVSPSKGVSS